MNRITWYVFHQLAVGLILFATGLTTVIWLSQSLKFIEMIVNRGLSAGTFIYMTMLMIPNFLPIILPIALFGVVVFIYSRMVTDRELVVMRAMGLNQIQLAKPALWLGFIVLLIMYSINIFILPQSYKMFGELKWNIRFNYSHILLQEGAFNTISNKLTIYVRERTKDGHLLGIFAEYNKDNGNPEVYMAKKGTMLKHGLGSRIIMFDGSRHIVDKKTNKFSILYFDRYVIDLDEKDKNTDTRAWEPRELTMSELFNLEDREEISAKDFGKFKVEAHKRLASPLSALTYMIIGLACLTGGAFTRRNQVRRVMLAIGIIVFLQITTLALENITARNLKLVPLIYLNVIVPLCAGFIGLVFPHLFRFGKWRKS